MLISAVYEEYTREQLEGILWKKHGTICELKTLLVTCAEEMHRLGSDKDELLKIIEDQHREDYKYSANYSIGAYNQMRTYIADLEEFVGKEEALKIRNNPHKYLRSWWDATEPK